MSTASFVETEDLTKVYKLGQIEVTALKGVGISIEEGRFVGVTGPSGAG